MPSSPKPTGVLPPLQRPSNVRGSPPLPLKLLPMHPPAMALAPLPASGKPLQLQASVLPAMAAQAAPAGGACCKSPCAAIATTTSMPTQPTPTSDEALGTAPGPPVVEAIERELLATPASAEYTYSSPSWSCLPNPPPKLKIDLNCP